ncbi:hypothetical protein [Thalassotalea mangrovi]|uniref:Peptidase M60 domain-containing protein n=1 Tax=Thalassotalea mangrovi TaxID=2572245 RepID=A0A4U1B3F9_9GAMM|nr:hypothetical protein [Thalassotalea mangrovi]TKB44368.1 hypothetical protein E8M12_12000 [Thalassotalea mangrovi]
MKLTQLALLFATTATLYACGGGSDSKPQDPITGDNIIVNDTVISKGSSVELVLLLNRDELSNIRWQQLSGPTANLVHDEGKVLAFTVPDAGEYSFQVNFQSDGQSYQDSISFTATSDSPLLVARLGHSVVEGGAVSLRAFVDNSLQQEEVSWQQTQGPNISFDNRNESSRVAIFNVPQVSQDTVIELQAEVTDSATGTTYTDTVSLLVENTDGIANNAYFDDAPLAKVFPYNSNSPYQADLVDCVYSNQLTSSCQLSKLPLLAQDTLTPTIDDIMDRVVVSHRWMGDRFKEYLLAYDNFDDFKNLLRATTAIVISYDVRPSFYWTATGAIYLDPNSLWLTPDERDTINEAPDYRADFGSDLQFVIPWRYTKDNEYVSFYVDPNERDSRPLLDIKYDLADLLYHELGHANDFLSPADWSSFSASQRVLDAANENVEISDRLDDLYPLLSQEMLGLAQVRFQGASANSIQRAYLPDDVAEFYKNDLANDFYNYTTTREDLAILFEETMMALRYGVRRDTAVTNAPQGDDITGEDYIVTWGQRGRVAVNDILPRAIFVTERLLPEFDIANRADDLLPPVLMTPGQSWIDNLDLTLANGEQLRSRPEAFSGFSGKQPVVLQTYTPHLRPEPKQ